MLLNDCSDDFIGGYIWWEILPPDYFRTGREHTRAEMDDETTLYIAGGPLDNPISEN